MRTPLASIAVTAAAALTLLAAAPATSADVTFAPLWQKLSNNDVNDPRVMGWDPVTNTMFLPEAAGGFNIHSYSGADGTKGANLSIEGLTLSFRGVFAIAGSSNGKIYGYNSGDGSGPLTIWDSPTATPVKYTWDGGFSRNLFTVGQTLYSTGAADSGAINVTSPGGDPLRWNLVETIGGPDAGLPGGKAGVTANAAGTLVFGAESVDGTPTPGIHVWAKESGNWTYKGDITFPTANPQPFPSTSGTPWTTDVAYDEANNLLFSIDLNTDKIFAVDLGDPLVVGDETYVGEYAVGTNTTFYASLEIDPANKRLYWMARNTDPSASFGVLNYSLPTPSLPGDTNDDGVVDLADLNNVLNNFGATGTSPGDDNNDGVVDLEDLNRVLNNFGDTAATSALSVIPEPSALACLFAGSPLFIRRRKPSPSQHGFTSQQPAGDPFCLAKSPR